MNNTILDNIFIDNKENVTSDGRSMRDLYNESNARGSAIALGEDALVAFFFVGLLVLVLIIAIIGIFVGLINLEDA